MLKYSQLVDFYCIIPIPELFSLLSPTTFRMNKIKGLLAKHFIRNNKKEVQKLIEGSKI